MAQRSQQKSFVTNCLHILIPEYNQSNTPLVSDIKIKIAIQLGEINRSFKPSKKRCSTYLPSAFCIIGSSESFYASSPDIYQPGMHAFQTVTSYYRQKYNIILGCLVKTLSFQHIHLGYQKQLFDKKSFTQMKAK